MFKHLRSFALLLILLIVVLTGCGGSATGSQPTSKRHKLVVYVVGLGEHLNSHDTIRNNGYGYIGTFYDPGHIQPFLQGTDEFKDATSLVFSYKGFSSDGKPSAFVCTDTYSDSIAYAASLLKQQINAYLAAHSDTDVYIVSHSLGSVVAFSFVANLIESTHSNALGYNSNLKGVSLNDGPIGGVTNDDNYLNTIILNSFGCSITGTDYTSIAQLQTLFNTASDENNRGATASVLNAFLGGRYIKNQQVAVDAMNAGVVIIAAGNLDDLLWRPDVCIKSPSFPSTEFLNEIQRQPNGGAVYSRSFEQGSLNSLVECGVQLALTKAHHADVLTRSDVQQAIYEAFTGQNIDKLDEVSQTTFMPVATPTNVPKPVPTPTPVPQPTQQPTSIPSPTAGAGGKWTGQLTYYYLNRAPDAVTLSLPTLPPEGQYGSPFFNGTWYAPGLNTVVVVNGTVGSNLAEFNSGEQSELSAAMAVWGQSYGKYIVFSDPEYLSGNQVQLDCLYAAIEGPKGQWEGVWYYPGSSSPDGTFNISPI